MRPCLCLQKRKRSDCPPKHALSRPIAAANGLTALQREPTHFCSIAVADVDKCPEEACRNCSWHTALLYLRPIPRGGGG